MAEMPPDPFFDETSCPIWSCNIKEQHTHDEDDKRLPINRQSKRKQGMKVPDNYICASCRHKQCENCVDVLRVIYSDDPICNCKRLKHGGEPKDSQILDPFNGSVHGPGAVISEDGEVTFDEEWKRKFKQQFGE